MGVALRKFEMREIEEALAYASNGGQALHLHNVIPDPAKAPGCFVRDVAQGKSIAHLFDLNTQRLIATAKKFGVRDIFIDRRNTPSQHVDLCGRPLERALRACVAEEQGVLFETGGGVGIYDET